VWECQGLLEGLLELSGVGKRGFVGCQRFRGVARGLVVIVRLCLDGGGDCQAARIAKGLRERCQRVVRLLSGNVRCCQGVVRMLSGCCQGVVRMLSGCFQGHPHLFLPRFIKEMLVFG